MRLCWLIPDDQGGGTAAVALSCCRQAAQNGHDVTLLMALPPTGHHTEHVDGFTVDSLQATEPYLDIPKRLVDWLDDHPQDAVFLNGCSEVEPAIPYIPSSAYCIDVVHDTAPQYWKRTVENESALDAIIAVSDTVARQFRDELSEPSRLQVCHNGTVFPEAPNSTDRADDILFVGASKPIKGCGDVIRLWPTLVENGFEGRLHWYGGLSASLQDTVASLPESSRIIDHGRVPRSAIFERAAHARVLLMLSRVEPFGMVTVEGMGMGAVPVAWDVETGTKEIIEPGKTGFFAPLGNFDKLADAVMMAMNEQPAMESEVVRVARSQFSEEAMWERYAHLLANLSSRPPVHRPHAGNVPPEYAPPTRYFQLLPDALRERIRDFVSQSPKLGYWLRDWRGF